MRRLWKNRCSPSSFPGTVSSRSFASAARRKPSNDGIAAAAAAADAAPSPSPKVLKIVEDIANLTLLEAADMSLLLKKRLRIQNVPVMSMGMNVMHDMWYDPLPLSPGPPPPPPPPRRSLPSSKRILPEEVHLNHGFLDDGAAAATRSIHASISEEDKYLYQLPSASSDNDTDYEHDPDRGDEEDDEEAMPAAKSRAPARKAKSDTPAAGAAPTAAKADAASKAKARKVKLVEGAVPSLAPPAADQKPAVKKPAAKKASPKPKKPAPVAAAKTA